MEQVSGNHYKSDYQHWDWAIDMGIGPLEYSATKYICRHWKKNGVEDLKKAIHFIEKLIEVNDAGKYYHYMNRALLRNDLENMQIFVEANKIPYQEARVCEIIATWQKTIELHIAKNILFRLIRTSEMAAGSVDAGQATATTHKVIKDVPDGPVGVAITPKDGKVNQPNPFGYKELNE